MVLQSSVCLQPTITTCVFCRAGRGCSYLDTIGVPGGENRAITHMTPDVCVALILAELCSSFSNFEETGCGHSNGYDGHYCARFGSQGCHCFEDAFCATVWWIMTGLGYAIQRRSIHLALGECLRNTCRASPKPRRWLISRRMVEG